MLDKINCSTVECLNPKVQNLNNAEIQTFLCSVSRCSDFRHLGCSFFSIVRFDLLCIEPNKNRSVLYHSLVFRQKKNVRNPNKIVRISDIVRNPRFQTKRFSIVQNPNLFVFQHSTAVTLLHRRRASLYRKFCAKKVWCWVVGWMVDPV